MAVIYIKLDEPRGVNFTSRYLRESNQFTFILIRTIFEPGRNKHHCFTKIGSSIQEEFRQVTTITYIWIYKICYMTMILQKIQKKTYATKFFFLHISLNFTINEDQVSEWSREKLYVKHVKPEVRRRPHSALSAAESLLVQFGVKKDQLFLCFIPVGKLLL